MFTGSLGEDVGKAGDRANLPHMFCTYLFDRSLAISVNQIIKSALSTMYITRLICRL